MKDKQHDDEPVEREKPDTESRLTELSLSDLGRVAAGGGPPSGGTDYCGDLPWYLHQSYRPDF